MFLTIMFICHRQDMLVVTAVFGRWRQCMLGPTHKIACRFLVTSTLSCLTLNEIAKATFHNVFRAGKYSISEL